MGEEIEITGWNPLEGRMVSESAGNKQALIRAYTGSQDEATRSFQVDSAKLASQGYIPISQTWAEGSYGMGAFLLAASRRLWKFS